MEEHQEYLVYLENRLRLREQSRSYRWTYPARVVWNLFHPVSSSATEEHFATKLKERWRHAAEDFETIRRSGQFDAKYACPWVEGNDHQALHHYIERWRKNIYLRKPRPGFHPGIYASKNGIVDSDPFAHFIRSGLPEGPWSLPVIGTGNQARSEGECPGVALHFHLYYVDQLNSILERLLKNRSRPDLFVSVSTDSDKRMVEEKFSSLGIERAVVKKFQNRGRNFGPLFTGFREILFNYEIIGHLHTKSSPHLESGKEVEEWRNFLLSNLLGDEGPMMDSIIDTMLRDKSLGLVFPDDPNVFGWFENAPYSLALARKMKMDRFKPLEHINFPVGSMFWARTQALKPILELNLDWEDYPAEPVADDGSMLHALERMIPAIVRHAGFESAVIHARGTGR